MEAAIVSTAADDCAGRLLTVRELGRIETLVSEVRNVERLAFGQLLFNSRLRAARTTTSRHCGILVSGGHPQLENENGPEWWIWSRNTKG